MAWTLNQLKTTFDPGAQRLRITMGDRTFEPLAGAGPVLLDGDEKLLPKAQAIALESTESSENGVRCVYRLKSGASFTLEITVTEENGVGVFRLR